MSDISIWTESSTWLEIVFNVLLVLLPTLAGAAALSVGGLRVLAWARDAYRTLRPWIDEPGDPLIKAIAEKTGRKPEDVTAFMTSNLDRVIELLGTGGAVK